MANWPTSVSTTDQLHTGVNNLATSLSSAINNSVTTIPVSSTTNFPSIGAITIDSERISYTGKTLTTFTGCTRGFGSTTAASHLSGKPVELTYGAEYHNDLRDEIIAIQQDLADRFGFNNGFNDVVMNGDLDMNLHTINFNGSVAKIYTPTGNEIILQADDGFTSSVFTVATSGITFTTSGASGFQINADIITNGYGILDAVSSNSSLYLDSSGAVLQTSTGVIQIDAFPDSGGKHILIKTIGSPTTSGDVFLQARTHSISDSTGFVLIPVYTGTPSTTPTMGTDDWPLLFNKGTNQLMVYNNDTSTWVGVTLS